MLQAGPPMLVNIALDLQIIICTLLHPSDILALRQTCKVFQLPTRQRVVWVAALHRVCFDNSLFLPSFPIPDMSNVELENAAMAPRRWIELCASFEKQHPSSGSCAQLRPRKARIIEHPSLITVDEDHEPDLFIVPGGRYMVSYSGRGIFVWDLGYTSSADFKLIASVGLEGGNSDCIVQATPDGMGLIILSSCLYEFRVYEVYPQSETPQLTHIAQLDFDPTTEDRSSNLLPNRVFWYDFYQNSIVFGVWDYRMNHSIRFTADIDLEELEYKVEVIATKTAVIVLCKEGILIWAIPPLLPRQPNFFDLSPTYIPSLFRIAIPDGIVNHADIFYWQTVSPWYSGTSQPLYFDILCRGSKLHRFEFVVKPDLFDSSFHIISTELFPHDLDRVLFLQYSICEDTLVAACWDSEDPGQFAAYTGLTSSRNTNVISQDGPPAKILLPAPPSASTYAFFLCPTSGRYVYFDKDIWRFVVIDLF